MSRPLEEAVVVITGASPTAPSPAAAGVLRRAFAAAAVGAIFGLFKKSS